MWIEDESWFAILKFPPLFGWCVKGVGGLEVWTFDAAKQIGLVLAWTYMSTYGASRILWGLTFELTGTLRRAEFGLGF